MALVRCMNCMEEYNEKNNRCSHCGYAIGQAPVDRDCLPPETVLQKRYVVGCVKRKQSDVITYIGWDMVLQKIISIQEYFPFYCVKRSNNQKEIHWVSEEDRGKFVRGLDKFVEEARQLARFREETGILRVYDNFEENGTVYTITEYTKPQKETLPQKTKGWKEKRKLYLAACIGEGILTGVLLLLFILCYMGNARENPSGMKDISRSGLEGLTLQEAAALATEAGMKMQVKDYCEVLNGPSDIILLQQCGDDVANGGDVIEVIVSRRGNRKEDTAEKREATTRATVTEKEATEEEKTEEIRKEVTTAVTEKRKVTATEQRTPQPVTEATTAQPSTQAPTTEKPTEEKTTEKPREDKKTEEKTTEQKTTQQPTTEAVIVIEE